MLTAADDALKSAAEAGNNRSERADNKFRKAISLLDPTRVSVSMLGIYGASTTLYPHIVLSALKSDLHARVRLPFIFLHLKVDEF